MENQDHILLNNLVYACVDSMQRGHEQFVQEHALGYIIAGESHLLTNHGTRIFKAGTVALVRRNQLIKSLKVPPPDGEFKAINIFLDQAFLRKYSAENKIETPAKYQGDPISVLPPDPFIKGYFDSLMPYFNRILPFKEAMAELKTREAVELLLHQNPAVKEFLFDFSEPYKIDLEAYMNNNYKFNVPIDQFAKLTGRSLAGFKRDFSRIFNTSPGNWLQQKRLSEAYYLIQKKGKKPAEIYLDIGFENLSHFYFAFKKTFGITPSGLV